MPVGAQDLAHDLRERARSASCAADMFTATLNVSDTPSARHCASCAQACSSTVATERDVEAGLLGHRDEVARVQQPALGVLPTHERLDPVDHPGAQVTTGW